MLFYGPRVANSPRSRGNRAGQIWSALALRSQLECRGARHRGSDCTQHGNRQEPYGATTNLCFASLRGEGRSESGASHRPREPVSNVLKSKGGWLAEMVGFEPITSCRFCNLQTPRYRRCQRCRGALAPYCTTARRATSRLQPTEGRGSTPCWPYFLNAHPRSNLTGGESVARPGGGPHLVAPIGRRCQPGWASRLSIEESRLTISSVPSFSKIGVRPASKGEKEATSACVTPR